MKARIIRSNIEVDVQPHYQEGLFVGFTETANPGLILYRPQDLVFPDSPESTHTDWESFRREAAKDILVAMTRKAVNDPDELDAFKPSFFAKVAVKWADALIKELKQN